MPGDENNHPLILRGAVFGCRNTRTGIWTTDTLGGNVTISGNHIAYTFPTPIGSRKFVCLKVIGSCQGETTPLKP